MYDCLTISKILNQLPNDTTYTLLGLSHSNNTIYCDWKFQFERLAYFQDFNDNLTNPLYQAELIQPETNEIFLPICYAYSILRIFMVASVIVYVIQKMKEILKQQTKKFPEEKEVELQFYKGSIYASMVVELICAVRDFVLFRGTLLFSNLMDQGTFNCFIDFFNSELICNSTSSIINSTYKSFNYSRTDCNCLYYPPKQYLDNDQQYNGYMTFSIMFWIISEAFAQGLVGFTVLILSRLNKEEKSGWPFIKPTFIRMIFMTFALMGLYSFLIYYFNLQLYYRFFSVQILGYYFIQKFIIFITIFDRLYSKVWLELKLRLPTLHSSSIPWSKDLNQLKKKVLRPIQPPNEINTIYQTKYRLIYEQTLDHYFNETLTPYIDRYEKEYNAKMKTQWYDYLNYLLLINLTGIFGYGFMVAYGIVSVDPSEKSWLFWTGFILALIELIVFEVSNLVFQLHCFFIELYRQCEEECSALNSHNQDSGLLMQFN